MILVTYICPKCAKKIDTLIDALVTCRCGKRMLSSKQKRRAENHKLRRIIRRFKRAERHRRSPKSVIK